MPSCSGKTGRVGPLSLPTAATRRETRFRRGSRGGMPGECAVSSSMEAGCPTLPGRPAHGAGAGTLNILHEKRRPRYARAPLVFVMRFRTVETESSRADQLSPLPSPSSSILKSTLILNIFSAGMLRISMPVFCVILSSNSHTASQLGPMQVNQTLKSFSRR